LFAFFALTYIWWALDDQQEQIDPMSRHMIGI
jgi:hypothetical protein